MTIHFREEGRRGSRGEENIWGVNSHEKISESEAAAMLLFRLVDRDGS